MNTLQHIEIILPDSNENFAKNLLSFLSPFGTVEESSIIFTPSNSTFVPKISLSFEKIDTPTVSFATDTTTIEIPLINETGIAKRSPHKYTSIELNEFISRLTDKQLDTVDHLGFNLPWFEGIHPTILKLREELKDKSLYHLFPTGEAWDFIIPRTKDEITTGIIDYKTIKKPKFEIVSFEKTSTPLIQCDLSIQESYENFTKLFPEALHIPEIRNMWVYIKNPYNIDFCFVVNEVGEGDWSEFFGESRLI